ncbi:MAG: helical backbone metal receptor [Vicinamibacteria bacterium]
MTEITNSSARRIVSLVPSMTETVFSLGAGDRVVGVTRFCVHPKEARERARIVGGTKNPTIDKILTLEPDLVLANQEENRREDVERLREHAPVHLAFPRSVTEAIADIRTLGSLLGKAEQAASMAAEMEAARLATRRVAPSFRYLYFIWRKPYMLAGPDTFIEAFLAEAGGVNAAPRGQGRYPEVGVDEIRDSGADVFLLSSEPFPFREDHRRRLAADLGVDEGQLARIHLVDGELLSWHGARLREGIPYLGSLAASLTTGKGRRPPG